MAAKARELLAVAPAPPVEGVAELAKVLDGCFFSGEHPLEWNTRTLATAAIQSLGVAESKKRAEKAELTAKNWETAHDKVARERDELKDDAATINGHRASLQRYLTEAMGYPDCCKPGEESLEATTIRLFKELRAEVERLRKLLQDFVHAIEAPPGFVIEGPPT